MAIIPVNIRVQKRRDALRMRGLRPVQVWVPDTRKAGFADECRRQSQCVAQEDLGDTDMTHFMGNVLADMGSWTE